MESNSAGEGDVEVMEVAIRTRVSSSLFVFVFPFVLLCLAQKQVQAGGLPYASVRPIYPGEIIKNERIQIGSSGKWWVV